MLFFLINHFIYLEKHFLISFYNIKRKNQKHNTKQLLFKVINAKNTKERLFLFYDFTYISHLENQTFWTTWNKPNEYPPISIHPSIAEIIVDLLLCLLIAFSIISFTSSLFISFVAFGFVEVICFLRIWYFEFVWFISV